MPPFHPLLIDDVKHRLTIQHIHANPPMLDARLRALYRAISSYLGEYSLYIIPIQTNRCTDDLLKEKEGKIVKLKFGIEKD